MIAKVPHLQQAQGLEPNFPTHSNEGVFPVCSNFLPACLQNLEYVVAFKFVTLGCTLLLHGKLIEIITPTLN